MANFKDLTGERFGRLEVLGVARKVTSGKRERYYWACRCDCGNEKEVRTDCLTSGLVKSCGCLKKEQNKINLTANHRHKLSRTRLYQEWQSMKDRCLNPNIPCYERYGGRGISICDDWLYPDNFFNWAMTNGYDNSLTIDRIDNGGDYEPSNCRWVDIKTQCRNRRSNIIVEYEGQEMTLIEASEKSGINYGALTRRYHKGDRGEKLFRPILKQQRLVEYNGKMITLKELSEITGIPYTTLVSRHFYKKPLIK